MSNVSLPLWNNEETDVLPPYHLSYGHVLCSTDVGMKNIEALAKCLHVGTVNRVFQFDHEMLPLQALTDRRTLEAADETHIIVAKYKSCSTVFAPHSFFFNNQPWIRWNKLIGGSMAVITRHDLVQYSYNVFREGDRIVGAWFDGERFKCLEDPAIEVYINGKSTYSHAAGEIYFPQTIGEMLSRDVRIHDDGEVIRFTAMEDGDSSIDATQYVLGR